MMMMTTRDKEIKKQMDIEVRSTLILHTGKHEDVKN